MSVQCVRMDADRQIATVTLDRVGVGNAIDERMASELREVCERIGRDDEIRVVVITGEGDTFCAGTDPLAMETAARILGRRGMKMRKGTASSMTNMIRAEALWNHSGSWWAYQAVQAGRGWVM